MVLSKSRKNGSIRQKGEKKENGVKTRLLLHDTCSRIQRTKNPKPCKSALQNTFYNGISPVEPEVPGYHPLGGSDHAKLFRSSAEVLPARHGESARKRLSRCGPFFRLQNSPLRLSAMSSIPAVTVQDHRRLHASRCSASCQAEPTPYTIKKGLIQLQLHSCVLLS